MELDAEMRRKIAVSVGAVVVFVGLVIGVGVTYATNHVLPTMGSYALVGVLAVFVVLMAAVGVYLDRR